MSTSLDLNGKWKNELIELVNTLTTENAILKGLQAYMETSNARLTKLEREQKKTSAIQQAKLHRNFWDPFHD